ncbi:hypothetical protein GCM10011365_25770 [Marinicella pacifica]|uniref:Tyr recombinase domain-containing protein n=1 Tax=Marinicella pacifica TaxID=1171543 RepID=A0A917FS67_9GAMM|nr:site-specific integrase [Marinicella pacifica]GGG03470.1 hypothetical protein GCM10011365_25770 [Marinicella pacifica]
MKSKVSTKSIEVAENEKLSNVDILSTHKNWLVGLPISDDWQFEEYLEGQYHSRLSFNWRPTYELATLQDQLKWDTWKNFAKNLCVIIFDESHSHIKPITNKIYAQNIKLICQYFCFEKNRLNIQQVTKEDILHFERHLKEKKISVGYTEALLTAVQFLWIKPLFADLEGLSFDPYPVGSSVKLVSKKIGQPNCHTTTLLPETGLALIDHALKLIKNSTKTIEDLGDYLNLKKRHRSRVFKRKHGYSATELFKKTDLIYGASIVLVLGLSAMRSHELSGLKYEDAVLIVEGKTNCLTGKVHKTANTITGKTTERHVINEIKQALEIILRLTSHVRKKNKNTLLLLKLPIYNSANSKGKAIEELGYQSLYKILDKFALDAGYVSGTLRPHMFRRFFAMMWTWRFELGDLEYLSRLLYHNKGEFTNAYIEDERVWEFMDEETKRMTYDIFEKMFKGELHIIGGFHKTVESYKNILEAKVTVISPESVHDFVERVIDRNNYSIIPAIDGYCFMSKSRGRRSKCSTNGLSPDYSNRSESTCTSCPNFGVSIRSKKEWESRLNAHYLVSKTTKSEKLKKASDKAIKAIKKLKLNIIS